jgi:hypothetical protein
MENIIKVALMLLTERRSGEPFGATRMTTAALCTGFAFVTLVAGTACGLTALWIFLEPHIGHAGAALSVGGILLILSGILLLVARSMFTPGEDSAPGLAIGEELLEELRAGFGDNKGFALIAALVAGLVVGGRKR